MKPNTPCRETLIVCVDHRYGSGLEADDTRDFSDRSEALEAAGCGSRGRFFGPRARMPRVTQFLSAHPSGMRKCREMGRFTRFRMQLRGLRTVLIIVLVVLLALILIGLID